MTKWDKLIAVFVITAAALAMLSLNVFVYRGLGTAAEIEVNGRPYGKYDFAQMNYEKSIEIITEYGYNIVNISKDGVWVSEADCPDQLDVRQGKINRLNQTIVCLPHRLVIRVTGGGNDVDATAY